MIDSETYDSNLEPDPILTFVESIYMPERAETVMEILAKMAEIGYTTHELDVANLVMTCNDRSGNDNANNLDDILQTHLTILISRYGIVLDKELEMPMHLKFILFESFFRVQFAVTKEVLSTFITDAIDPVESYARLVEEVFGVDFNLLCDYMVEVRPMLFERLESTFKENVATVTVETIDNTVYRNRVKKFSKWFSGSILQRYLNNAGRLGFDLTPVLSLQEHEFESEENIHSPVIDILLFIMGSNTPGDTLEDVITNGVEVFSNDPSESARMNGDIMIEIMKAGISLDG